MKLDNFRLQNKLQSGNSQWLKMHPTKTFVFTEDEFFEFVAESLFNDEFRKALIDSYLEHKGYDVDKLKEDGLKFIKKLLEDK